MNVLNKYLYTFLSTYLIIHILICIPHMYTYTHTHTSYTTYNLRSIVYWTLSFQVLLAVDTLIPVEISTLKYVIWWKNWSQQVEFCGSGQRYKLQGKFYHNKPGERWAKKIWSYNLENIWSWYTRHMNEAIRPFIHLDLFMLLKVLITIANEQGVKFFMNYNF